MDATPNQEPKRVDAYRSPSSGEVTIPELEPGHAYAVYLDDVPLALFTIPAPKLAAQCTHDAWTETGGSRRCADCGTHLGGSLAGDDFPCCSPGSTIHEHESIPYHAGTCRYCGGRIIRRGGPWLHVDGATLRDPGSHPAEPEPEAHGSIATGDFDELDPGMPIDVVPQGAQYRVTKYEAEPETCHICGAANTPGHGRGAAAAMTRFGIHGPKA